MSTLWGIWYILILISYDIACQFYKNFFKRMMKNFPPTMQLDTDPSNISWAVPKKHIAVHGPNHSQFSLNFLPGVGKTYGEGIESGWSHMNPISMSTKEMGPAVRHETLDDHWGSWNWMKILALGNNDLSYLILSLLIFMSGWLLAKSLLHAYLMQEKHRKIFEEYNVTFPTDLTYAWRKHIEKWNKDHSVKPDPYEDIETCKC